MGSPDTFPDSLTDGYIALSLRNGSVQVSPVDDPPPSLGSAAGTRMSFNGSTEPSTPTDSPSTRTSLDTLSDGYPYAETEFDPPLVTGRFIVKTPAPSITLVGVDGSELERRGFLAFRLACNGPFFEDLTRPYVTFLPPPDPLPDSFDSSPLRIYLQHPGDTRDAVALAVAADECAKWSELGVLRDLPLKAFSDARHFANRYLGCLACEMTADYEKAKTIGVPVDVDDLDEWLLLEELCKEDGDESDYEESDEEGASDESDEGD
ncbi:hypothetical protein IAT38_005926 [Cryptococcus sp. DSM 104549]